MGLMVRTHTLTTVPVSVVRKSPVKRLDLLFKQLIRLVSLRRYLTVGAFAIASHRSLRRASF